MRKIKETVNKRNWEVRTLVFREGKVDIGVQATFTNGKFSHVTYGKYEGGICWSNSLPNNVLMKLLSKIKDKEVREHIIEEEKKKSKESIGYSVSDIKISEKRITDHEKTIVEQGKRLVGLEKSSKVGD